MTGSFTSHSSTKVLRLVNGSKIAVSGSGIEEHVGGVDGLESAHRRSVEAEALLEHRFGQLADGQREVVLHTGDVGEAHIHELRTL